jgi:hypothetical protein
LHNCDTLSSALIKSGMFDTSHWSSVCALTLTIRQAFFSEGRRVPADQHQCTSAFRHFIKLLNLSIFGHAFQRFGRRLRVIPVLEKDALGRFHFHAALEKPAHFSDKAFSEMLHRCWSPVHWAYRDLAVKFNSDDGWLHYILKPSQKSGLECWSDCIDWTSFHNPTAGA